MGSQELSYRVGYALEAEKAKSFIVPSLVKQVEAKGIELVPLDPTRPISEQGKFHCIVHKIYGSKWASELTGFTGPVVDPLDRIELLHNRNTMLEVVSRVNIPSFDVLVPEQRVVTIDSMSDFNLDGLIRFPVIAKPLLANAGAGSHDMMLIMTSDALQRLPIGGPPFLLQEFVNHGGVVFKVYVIGRHATCVRRSSLPDVVGDVTSENVVSFSRISDAPAAKSTDYVIDLPIGLIEKLARALGDELGLRLFNFDVIKSNNGDGDKYYVIDINYFPGYDKMPNFEHIFADFLLDVVRGEPHRRN